MTILEAIVLVFGEDLGITGAFICFEGMGDLLWYLGGETGACLMYHPELGWAYYTYSGSVCGLMIAGGISVIAGFWTWHSEEKFTFDDWKGVFEGTVTTGGIGFIGGSIVKFNNLSSTITGWGVGIGGGLGYGVAGFEQEYKRAENWMIPPWLWNIVDMN